MYEKLFSLVLAVYLFILGIPYGNGPIKVDLTYEMESTREVYTDGDELMIHLKGENVGRPFFGKSHDNISGWVFHVVDGERRGLSVAFQQRMILTGYPSRVLLKNGDCQNGGYHETLENSEPGFYSLEIRFKTFDGTTITKVFENIIEVR